MLTFLRREPVLRWTPLAAALNALVIWVLFDRIGLVDREPGDVQALGGIDGEGLLLGPYVILLNSTMIWAVAIQARAFSLGLRIHPNELALPVSPRRIIFERAAAHWANLFIPLLFGLAAIAASGVHSAVIAQLAVMSSLAVTACVVLLYASWPRSPKLGGLRGVATGALAWLLWAGPLIMPGLPWSAVFVGVIALGGTVWWFRAPLAGARFDQGSFRGLESLNGAPQGARLFGTLRWTVLRCALFNRRILPSVVMLLVLLPTRYGNSPFFAYVLPALLAVMPLRLALQSLHRLSDLPISRARLVRPTVIGTFIVIVLALALSGRRAPRALSFETIQSVAQVDFDEEGGFAGEDEPRMHVRVPARGWRVTGNPEDLLVTAPWGESVQVPAHPLWPGSEVVAYCPYDVGESSSYRFLAWQLSRAFKDVHGIEFTSSEVFEILGEDNDLGAGTIERMRLYSFKPGNLPFEVDSRRPRGIVGLRALLGGMIWLLGIAVVLRPNVPDIRGSLLMLLVRGWPGTVLPFVIPVLPLAYLELGDGVLLPVIEAQLAAFMDKALGGSALGWAVAVALPMLAGHALLAWRLDRIEVPPRILNGWTKQPMPTF